MKHAQLPTLSVERATGLPDTSLYGDSRHTTADASALQLESDEAQSLLARRHGTISEGSTAALHCQPSKACSSSVQQAGMQMQQMSDLHQML